MTKIEAILDSAKYLDSVGMSMTADWLREYAAALRKIEQDSAATGAQGEAVAYQCRYIH